MPKPACHPYIPRRAPRPERPVCLSELRATFDERGLQLAVDAGIEIRSGDRVLHVPQSLADAQAWLAASAC